MTSQEIQNIRNDFPILNTKIFNKNLIYFDNAATTQKPKPVIDSISEFYKNYNANVHRGIHFLSIFCTNAMENSREVLRNFINADSIEEIIFTRGTTESINLVAYSFGENFINNDDEIIISTMEHHSNIVPWQLLRERKKCILKIVPINNIGELLVENLIDLITERTKIVSLTAASNVLGTLNDIKGIIKKIRIKNSKVVILIDGAQLVAHSTVDVKDLDCDFFAFSAHKLYGPTGIGVLFGKKEILEKMPPFMGGGEMIKKVSFEKTTFNDLPYKFEAGTPNYIDAIAFAKSIEYIKSIGLKNIQLYEKKLLNFCTEEILKIEKIKIYGEAKEKSGVISFNVENIHHGDIGTLLDKLGIAIRSGTHCAEPLMQFLKISGTARVSFAVYNTIEEIEIFISALKKVIEMLKL